MLCVYIDIITFLSLPMHIWIDSIWIDTQTTHTHTHTNVQTYRHACVAVHTSARTLTESEAAAHQTPSKAG